MKPYLIASLSLIVVCGVVAFVAGLTLEMIFPPPQRGAWLYSVAVIVGVLAGITSFRASFKANEKSEKRNDS